METFDIVWCIYEVSMFLMVIVCIYNINEARLQEARNGKD